jgi:hypothetical protein
VFEGVLVDFNVIRFILEISMDKIRIAKRIDIA